MKIKRLVIENFKSIERIELIEPNPFTVFVGPNGSGKSNIFEALEFVNYSSKSLDSSINESFGGIDKFLNRKRELERQFFIFECDFESFSSQFTIAFNADAANKLAGHQLPLLSVIIDKVEASTKVFGQRIPKNFLPNQLEKLAKEKPSTANEANTFYNGFSRIFIGNERYEKIKRNSDVRLSISAFNLEKVLGRLLNDLNKKSKEEIVEWLNLFIPDSDKIEIINNSLTGEASLLFYNKLYERPFTKDLISDGTYNILALLTAVYQSDEPQFLCIEEPENGLHPQVQMALVEFFRKICKEKGHYIWLNTHSEAIVRKLTTDEIVLVDKKEGVTQIQQVKGMNIYDIPTDEAWLTGTLGGGLPW